MTAPGRERAAASPLRSLLVPLDLSSGAARIAARAVSLPLHPSATLTFVHVVPSLLPPKARRRAQADAAQALASVCREQAKALPEAELRSVVRTGLPAAEIASEAEAVGAELVVMGRVGARGWADLFIGSTAERVVRQVQRPVLVVRLPVRGPYRRPLVALDLDDAAVAALAFTQRLLPWPAPAPTVLHVYEAPLGAAVYPSFSEAEAKAYRLELQRRTQAQWARRLAGAHQAGWLTDAEGVRRRLVLQHGSPRSLLPRAVVRRRTDLLVMGTRGRSGMAQAFLGTIAGDVLREVRCDVLLVPPPPAAEAG
jgi:nucleotide-binding universal stress UspA family protein